MIDSGAENLTLTFSNACAQLSLWVFPEGTRSNLPFPDLLPFKKGAFHLAVQAQVPIVPVVCENYHRYFDGKTRFESGSVRIKGE